MTISIAIRDFRGVERADVVISNIVLAAGLNRAGKSSLALGLGAVLGGRPLPFPGLRKADAGLLVKTGASK